jgi:hypothetical protein
MFGPPCYSSPPEEPEVMFEPDEIDWEVTETLEVTSDYTTDCTAEADQPRD